EPGGAAGLLAEGEAVERLHVPLGGAGQVPAAVHDDPRGVVEGRPLRQRLPGLVGLSGEVAVVDPDCGSLEVSHRLDYTAPSAAAALRIRACERPVPLGTGLVRVPTPGCILAF